MKDRGLKAFTEFSVELGLEVARMEGSETRFNIPAAYTAVEDMISSKMASKNPRKSLMKYYRRVLLDINRRGGSDSLERVHDECGYSNPRDIIKNINMNALPLAVCVDMIVKDAYYLMAEKTPVSEEKKMSKFIDVEELYKDITEKSSRIAEIYEDCIMRDDMNGDGGFIEESIIGVLKVYGI